MAALRATARYSAERNMYRMRSCKAPFVEDGIEKNGREATAARPDAMNKKSMNEQGFSLVKIDEVHGDQGNAEKNRKNRGQIKLIFFENNRAG